MAWIRFPPGGPAADVISDNLGSGASGVTLIRHESLLDHKWQGMPSLAGNDILYVNNFISSGVLMRSPTLRELDFLHRNREDSVFDSVWMIHSRILNAKQAL